MNNLTKITMVASFKQFRKAMNENNNDYRLATEALKVKDYIVKEKLKVLDKTIAENAEQKKYNDAIFQNIKSKK